MNNKPFCDVDANVCYANRLQKYTKMIDNKVKFCSRHPGKQELDFQINFMNVKAVIGLGLMSLVALKRE